ncbi:YwmB family TATA-box binding protein [Bacillus thermotolerans]|uniref:TATA-box binding n=1 Tax=Bacillus thermotolerans TaxID=1221996 RepID=A0A0F5I745_BACTR|nr:YwmB family TATA-box binding protein [Bacillus thermotolerans]KKB36536.1 hypothetical protein QY97_00935 [Bacillus thermotolerans]KKB40997.1 hypothetical protein QY95_01060 [Bacillus thermotolerans]KKB44937.1 hypothetical protein QY96_00061 [Bacillus thermotolerans]
MKLVKLGKYLLVFCFIIWLFGNRIDASGSENQLLLLTDSVKSVEGNIEEWMLHTREPLKEREPDDVIRSLKRYLAEWEILPLHDNEVLFAAVHSQGTVKQKVQVISPDTAGGVAYVLYSASATDEEEMRSFLTKNFSSTYSHIFHSEPQVFACVKGFFNGRLEMLLSNQLFRLLSNWEIEEKTVVSEQDFYSLTAFSKQFPAGFSLLDNEMNVQVGLRESQKGSKTNFVIGTPIITIEY